MNRQKLWYIIKVIILALLILISKNSGAQDDPIQEDMVSIMKLDMPLHARSRLGGLCVDRLGYIYVSNFHDAVWKISRQGVVKLLSDGLYGSSGNTIDAKGNLYQAGFFDHSIVKIDRFGQVTPFIKEGLNGPVGMVFDAIGNLYVCNFHDNNILKIAVDKTQSIFAVGDMFSGPNGITIDNDENLYVCNFNNNQIIKITPKGEPSTFTEIPGPDGNAHIVFYQDNFFLTKIKSNQVFRINKNGDIRLIGGSGKSEITTGPASTASFSAPNGIGVDAQSGELFLNNVNGVWGSRNESTMEISKITLLSLSQMLSNHLDKQDIEGAKRVFWQYHQDDFHALEDLGPPVGSLGWRYMSKRNVSAALTLFELIHEAYPERWRPNYYLGETYKIIGQPEKALEFYLQALKLNPENPLVKGKVNELSQ